MQEFLKTVEHTVVAHLARYKLTLIEPCAMVKHGLDVRCHNLFGVLVYGVFQFLSDFTEAINDDGFLAL